MKSKIFTLLFALILFGASATMAQPLNWKEDSPEGWVPLTIEKEIDPAYITQGSTSVKITFTETGTPYFICDTFNVATRNYNFSIDVFDNDPGSEYSVRLLFHDASGVYINRATSDFTLDSPSFQAITMTGEAPEGTAKVYVVIRFHDVVATWTGSGTVWLDNCIYSDGVTSNLVPNFSFEEWVTPVEFVSNWREDSPAGWAPITIEKESNPAKVTNGATSVKISFTETGTPYFICDTFQVATRNYNFSIDVFDNDPGAEYSVRLLFHDVSGVYINRATSDFTLDNAAFQAITMTGEAPEGTAKVYVVVRLHDVVSAWTGSSTVWLDNCVYSDGVTPNLVPNFSFENWYSKAIFQEYAFQGLNPAVVGTISPEINTINLTVPFQTNLSALVATFVTTSGSVAKVGDVVQESGVTPNNFTNPVVYNLSIGSLSEDWTVIVGKTPASTEKDIYSFKFEELDPTVNGLVNPTAYTVDAEVPFGTNLTNLVPTISISSFATISPASGLAQDFTNPVTYTVTAEDGTTQQWVVEVSQTAQGVTTLFYEDFEDLSTLPSDWIVINNDGYIQASGEERWQDSAWLVTTSNRIELQGTKLAMASSYCSNMPLEGRADDWMILPAITLGDNSSLSWQAMSTTSSGNYPDDYMVLVAPAAEGITPTIPYFEENAIIAFEIDPENWSAYVGNPGQGLATRNVNLKDAGFADVTVWIAFVLTTDLTPGNSTAGGSNLAVDNIAVINGLTGLADHRKNMLPATLYPNPAKEAITLSFDLNTKGEAIIEVLDITGRTVLTDTKQVSLGSNNLSIDISSLEKGIYTVRTSINRLTNTSKLVVR